MSSCRPWKEGKGAKQNIPKPKSKPKPKTYPMSKVKQMAIKTFEPESTQDNENMQEGMKLAEAISPLPSSIENQEPLAQPPEKHENSPNNTSFMDVLANRHPKIDLAFVLRDRYAGNNLF